MKRSEAIQLIKQKQEELSQKYHVASLYVFGSVARDEARPDSDIDILVEFSQPVGLFLLLTFNSILKAFLNVK